MRFKRQDLQEWVTNVFCSVGVSAEDAAITAAVLVRTNLRGIDTHGITRTLDYVQKIRSGEINAAATTNFLEHDGVINCNGNGGLGQAVATLAVRKAIDAAGHRPIVTCLIERSGHLAAIGQFVLEAAEAGMVGILCQETPPLMALKGSHRPAIGNNPIAFALPLRDKAPLVFDMATSVVARGTVIAASREQRQIPEDWAIGPDGQGTTDPDQALLGAMLPIAGHKGIGLAMLVQCLAGSLTGSHTRRAAATHGSMSSAGNVSAFMMVINPALLTGRAAFDDHVDGWLSTTRRH